MDDLSRGLEVLGNLASILTGIVAVWAGSWYLFQRRQRRLRLESCLKEATADNDGLKSVIDLMAELGMTEAEVVDAAFRSHHIVRFTSPNLIGSPPRLLLRYSKKASK